MARTPSSITLCVAVLVMAGCDSGPAGKNAAPSSTATMGEAFHDAELVARQQPGRQTAMGRGDSMAPVYGDETLLVINAIAYDDLKPGMTVAYVNTQGRRVVHKLVSKTRDGWMVAGLNNSRIDTDLVTPKNLLGVIYATFHYTGEEQPK